MIYLPDQWIKDKSNIEEIRNIIEALERDIVTLEILKEKDKAIERLKEMGEDILYEKIKNQVIVVAG